MIRLFAGLIFMGGASFLAGQKPLFSLLKPVQTHVSFNNEIVDTKAHNILIYSNYYGGAGVGIGDFNRDGLYDLYFAGNLVGDRLYLNQGDFRFEDVTETAGIEDRGGWSSGVVIADVNRDGYDDIYVTKELYDDRPDLRRNELYINQGDGTFEEMAAAYGVDSDARTRHALFFDYDKDGWLDLYLLNHPPNAGNYSNFYGIDIEQDSFASRLYRNTGSGRFVDVTREAGLYKIGYPNSGVASDINNDGWTDLYIANDFAKPDWLFLNNGDGTFTNVIDSAARHISYFGMGVDAADINNDGWTDLMVLDMQAEDNYRIKSNMSGMDPEAFWKVVDEGGHYQYMFNTLQLNQGRRADDPRGVHLSDIAQLAGVSNTDWSWSNLIADFDNDGWKDLHITNGLLRDIRNTDADKHFSEYVQNLIRDFVQSNPDAGAVSIWDILDLDEALRIIPTEPLQNYAYRNNGDLTFTKVIEEWGFERETFSHGSAYADLDNDGDLDIVINNINEKAYIYRNNAERNPSRNHYLRVKLADRASHHPVFGAKVEVATGDGTQWYEFSSVRGMYSTSEPVAHFGLGAAEKADRVIVHWWDGARTVLEDVPADQMLEIDYSEGRHAVSSPAPRTGGRFCEVTQQLQIDFVHEENPFDDFEKQVLLPHKMSQFGPALAVGDVNLDGREDLYVGGAAGQAGKLLIQTETGFRTLRLQAFEEDRVFEDVDAVFLDIEGDGDLDLYVVSGGNAFEAGSPYYADRIYENNGKGVLLRKQDALPPFFESGSVVRPHDYDRDGDLDLFIGGRHLPWQYPTPTSSRLLENRNGRYLDVTTEKAPALIGIGMVTDAVWSDPDQDGLVDLIVVGEWMPITLLKQGEGAVFEKKSGLAGLSHTEGWWFSVKARDMDQDGDEDLIVGNLGLNYKYKASREEPFEVYYYDFDENGSDDIVLSYYNFGEKYPLRGRSCSSMQVPELKKKFPSYNIFASADLETVYSEKDLSAALHLQAMTFASAYLENAGNGTYTFRPLPNEAQISSINSILPGDFDGDGVLDLLVAGNLYVSEIETPRNDAGLGLLLKGDGQGGFRAVPPGESELFLPYDVKKMAVVPTASLGDVIIVAPNDAGLIAIDRE